VGKRNKRPLFAFPAALFHVISPQVSLVIPSHNPERRTLMDSKSWTNLLLSLIFFQLIVITFYLARIRNILKANMKQPEQLDSGWHWRVTDAVTFAGILTFLVGCVIGYFYPDIGWVWGAISAGSSFLFFMLVGRLVFKLKW
jgi:hypothetical protein